VRQPEPSTRTEPARRERLAVLGGTFDPPHLGHLWLATTAADEMDLSKVLLVPAANPPHKRRRAISHAADRVLMTRRWPTTRVRCILVELGDGRPTVDTLDELGRRHPDIDLV
jgi:nicotinate-nucleotide adenylyltransferase